MHGAVMAKLPGDLVAMTDLEKAGMVESVLSNCLVTVTDRRKYLDWYDRLTLSCGHVKDVSINVVQRYVGRGDQIVCWACRDGR